MATTEPQKWAATLGNTADVNAIPATTPSGSGRASFSGLFPPVTQLPLDQGGIAPERGDFNALFKYLGEYLFYLMQGGMFSYTPDYDYTAGNFVLHGGSLYLCIAANGPSSAVKYPTDADYWRQLALTSQLPIVNNGTLTIQRNGSNVATFSANQVGNTTANISVPTVNNGTLTIRQNGVTVGTFTANQSGNTTVNITGGGGNWPPIVFRAINDYSSGSSAIDSAMRAAGYWRCGYAITTWGGYGSGGAGYTSYVAYAPAGYTVTQLDIDIAGDVGHSYGLDPTYSGGSPISAAGCWGWYHCPAPTNPVRREVQKPTAGMTSASEYALPTP